MARTLFPLTRHEIEEHWVRIGDVVMGGRSRSEIVFEEPATLVFSGEVSLEDGGGFASIRRKPDELALDGARAVLLEVQGDGRRYKLSLRCDADPDGIVWQSAFATNAGERQEFRLPVDSFAPSYHGSPRPQAGPLQAQKAISIGFVVGDRQAGPFRLRVFRIAACL